MIEEPEMVSPQQPVVSSAHGTPRVGPSRALPMTMKITQRLNPTTTITRAIIRWSEFRQIALLALPTGHNISTYYDTNA